MPKRSDTHVVADIAVSRVMQVCNDCGWACETVHKDYGEDLLVQTQYKGRMDHHRIWIQVKGTRRLKRFFSRKHGYSLRVSSELLLKWIRSMDPVIVVLWDVEQDKGLWAAPRVADEYDLYFGGSNPRVCFSESAVFDTTQAQKIAWMARLNHYAILLNQSIYYTMENQRLGDKHRSRAPLLLIDLLHLFGILAEESIMQEFVKHYFAAVEFFRKDHGLADKAAKRVAASFILICRAHEVTGGCGLPVSIVNFCGEAAYLLAEKYLEENPDYLAQLRRTLNRQAIARIRKEYLREK